MRTAEAAEEYLDHSRLRKADSTLEMDERNIGEFMQHAAGEVVELTEEHVRRYQDHLLERGLKASTVRRKMASVRAFLSWADKVGMIDDNPARLVDRPKLPRKAVDWFPEEDMEDIIDATSEASEPYPSLRSLVLVAYLTGLRPKEMSFLEWGDIDLNRRTLWVRGKKGFRPKGGSDRKIPIPVRATECLRSIKGRSKGGYVWTNGGLRVRPVRMLRLVQRYTEDLDLPFPVTFQRIRHTYACRLVSNGVSIFKVSKLLGHSSVTTTERYYADLSPCKLHEEIDGAFKG